MLIVYFKDPKIVAGVTGNCVLSNRINREAKAACYRIEFLCVCWNRDRKPNIWFLFSGFRKLFATCMATVVLP